MCSPVELPTAFLKSALRHVLNEQGLDPDSRYELDTNIDHLWVSSAYRIKVCPETGEPLQLFMKSMPDDAERRESFEIPRLFQNETAVYTQFLSAGRDLGIFSAAPWCCYATANSEESVLVLEDLTASGYKMLDRIKGLGYEDTMLLMKEIGRFQALSFTLKSKQPERLNKLISQLRQLNQDSRVYKLLEAAYSKANEVALEEVRQEFGEESECFQKYSKFVRQMPTLKNSVIFPGKGVDDTYFVVSHCDLWVNNFMFRYPEGASAPDSMKLLDFQGTRYTTLGLDVAYVLLTVADQQQRDRGWNELLRAYYDSFCAAGGEGVLSWKILEQEVAKGALYSLAVGVFNLAHTHDEGGGEFQVQQDSDDPMLAGLTSALYRKAPRCKKRILDLIEECVKRGFLGGL